MDATAIPSQAQTFTTLVNFNPTTAVEPLAPLVQGTDGNFYGTTVAGPTSATSMGNGTVFKMTPQGALTVLLNLGFEGYLLPIRSTSSGLTSSLRRS